MENPLVNIDAGLQARQQVASSPAFDLVKTNAPEEEIRAALSPDVRQAIPLALRQVRQQMAGGGPADQEAVAVALGRQIGLLKAGLAAEHKEDWIGIAFAELQNLPPDLLLDALREVRRSARFEGDVVPAVLAIVEPQVAKLETERKTLERLEAIAG